MATTERERAPDPEVGRGGTYVFDIVGVILCVVGVIVMANVVGLV